jgi:carboxypeptidase Taq
MFSMLHEAGHALYEQGIDPSYEGLPLAGGTSSGVHESQSRLWENVVGRSAAFWSHHYPALVAHFPDQLSRYGVNEFVRAINRVQPSLIRTEADEVTYNLHVMIRFDLEVALIEGRLSVADLPDAWRARYKEDLGVSAPDDTDGVLQDVHWYGGLVGGAFQGYTLGNVMSAQFYDAAVRAHPSIPSDVAAGRFDDLRAWLTNHVYRHGAKFLPAELLLRATGESLRIEPYLGYLKEKYGALYGIDLGAGNGAAVADVAADSRG